MEQWLRLEEGVARLRFRLTYTGDKAHQPRHQELPALFVKPALDGDPTRLRDRAVAGVFGRAVGLAHLGGVAPEDVLDLRDQQLLVLLLVLDAGEDEEREALEVGVGSATDHLLHALVDGLAEAVDLVVGRPGHEAAMVALDARSQSLVEEFMTNSSRASSFE